MLWRMVIDFLEIEVEQGVCKGCALGKHSNATFPHNKTRSKGVLDLVHSEICGAMSLESISLSLCFATFINEFSRRLGSTY